MDTTAQLTSGDEGLVTAVALVHLLWNMDAEHVGSPAGAALQSSDIAGRSPAPWSAVEVGSTFMVRGTEWTVKREAKPTELLSGDPHTYTTTKSSPASPQTSKLKHQTHSLSTHSTLVSQIVPCLTLKNTHN